MNKKITKGFLLALMSLALVACSNEENARADKETTKVIEDNNQREEKEEKEKEQEEEAKEEPKPEDEKEEAPNTDSNFIKTDGKYVSTMIASANGQRDEYVGPTIHGLDFKDDALVVQASLDYYINPEDYENVQTFDDGSYSFTIDDSTVFQAVGGLAPAKKFSREEFKKYYEECKDTGLALIIFVEDGIAKEVSISS